MFYHQDRERYSRFSLKRKGRRKSEDLSFSEREREKREREFSYLRRKPNPVLSLFFLKKKEWFLEMLSGNQK
uniref:Uncharacterized protein n=1 Tax=Salix viminalis TaxID=40686 RepID=A0A6N2KPC9_SALVM